jgi:hypothetical protein
MGDNGVAAPEQRAGSGRDLLFDKEGKAVACCYLANPLPVSVTVHYQCEITGYYRETAGRDAQRITLPAHSRIRREVKFTVTPDNPAYTIEARIKATRAPDLGWPEADTVSFFPGVRQSVPWPECFQYRDLRRLVFDRVQSGDRQFVMLRDQWEAALTTDREPPVPAKEKLSYIPKSLPVSFDLSSVTPRPHSVYLRRTFDLPADLDKTAYRLCVCDPIDEATAYVNGRKVGVSRAATRCSLPTSPRASGPARTS